MVFKINYQGLYSDYVIIEGETIEEIQEKAKQEMAYRGWEEENCWSENLSEDYK